MALRQATVRREWRQFVTVTRAQLRHVRTNWRLLRGAMRTDQNMCERCEGDGSYSRLADCTTGGPDCACNGARVTVDPCDVCGGSGKKAKRVT